MKFQPGQSGNPNGRPKGALSKRTQLAKLLEPHAEEIIAKLVSLALEGELNALRICIERLIPKPKVEAVEFDLEEFDLNSIEDLATLSAEILKGMANQELTIEQAQMLLDIIEAHRDTVMMHDFVERIAALEKRLQ